MGAQESPIWENIETHAEKAKEKPKFLDKGFNEDNSEYTVQTGGGMGEEALYSISIEIFNRAIENTTSYTEKNRIKEKKKIATDGLIILDEKIQEYADKYHGGFRTEMDDPFRINGGDKIKLSPEGEIQIKKASILANGYNGDKDFRNLYTDKKD